MIINLDLSNKYIIYYQPQQKKGGIFTTPIPIYNKKKVKLFYHGYFIFYEIYWIMIDKLKYIPN